MKKTILAFVLAVCATAPVLYAQATKTVTITEELSL